MITFPNCKINLGLNVVRKREDGFHDIETVFYPIALRDSLEIIQSSEFKFFSSGLQISGSEKDNLCVQAYNILKKDFAKIPPVHIHLHKAIPMGAGLGGGSADAAFMLLMLNKKFNLQITEDQLIKYALQLGSDCPFFIINKPMFATGRGEIMDPITVDLSSYKFVLINPGTHISTKEAFAKLTPNAPEQSIKNIVNQPVKNWKDVLYNDFEETIFVLHPQIKSIKKQLYNLGATYASMTGTGSTVFGLFEKNIVVKPDFPPNYMIVQVPA
jgi:4-diphosphocytidyl-2-C-methyl-D-erythritol kinase